MSRSLTLGVLVKRLFSLKVINLVRCSLMLRVLLPVGGLLVAVVAGSVIGVLIKDRETARTALSIKTRLIAEIAGRSAADILWNLDATAGRELLAALAVDPEYVGSDIIDDRGDVFVANGAKFSESGSMIAEKVPVVRNDKGQQKTVGALELRVSTALADENVVREGILLSLIGAGSLVVVCGLLFVILRRSTRPIVALTNAMAKLSSGGLDTIIPALDRQDEVGRMAHAVEVFKQNANEVARLNGERDAMKNQAERERFDLLNRMIGQFESTVSSVVTSIAVACTKVGTRTEAMASRMTQAEQNSRAIMQATGSTSDSVQTVASATQELSASIDEITSRVQECATIASITSNAAEGTSGTIAELSEQAKKIGNIVRLIHEIASQTNLLALNATIEAATAGVAGKGFTVVAQEVKSLAAQTASATGEISANVQAIQAATAQAVLEIRQIAEVANRSREITTSISNAIEQQSVATREISSSVSRAASGTQIVAQNVSSAVANITEASAATQELLSASQKLLQEFQMLQDQVRSFVSTVRAAA